MSHTMLDATNLASGCRAEDHAVIVTCDSHVGPLLTEQLREYCPREHAEAFDAYVAAGASTVRPMPDFGDDLRTSVLRNQLTDGGWEMSTRLTDMNDDGVAGEVVFHGLNTGRIDPLPFSSLLGGERGDRELLGVGRHMYNRWLADYCSEEPERHAGLAQLPMWDIDAAVQELEWAREVGLRGVNFPRVQPGILPYNHPAWDPFWAAAEDLDMPLTTHAQSGGTTDLAAEGTGNHILAILEVTGIASRRAFQQLVFGGVFDRHPRLKIVFTEQPGQWWRPMLDEMDSIYTMLRNTVKLERMPSDYGDRHMFVGATCLAPFEAADAVTEGYSRNVLWGSDYPHPEGTWQYARYDGEPSMSKLAMRDTFADIPTDETAAMLGENAARVYGFDLAKLRGVAERIGAPTFEELAQPLEGEPEDRRTRSAAYAFRRHNAYH
jgi:predicted TIM-barrel fold metal-dependent hydrolase